MLCFFLLSGRSARALVTALAGVLASLHAGPAAAQPDTPPGASGWRSAFEAYLPHDEVRLQSWREANDRVGLIGGWRAYAREAQAPAGPAAPASQAPGSPAVTPGPALVPQRAAASAPAGAAPAAHSH